MVFFFLNHLHSLDLISFLSCYKCMIFFASVRPGFYCFLLLCILSIQFNENNKKKKESKKKIEEVIETWS